MLPLIALVVCTDFRVTSPSFFDGEVTYESLSNPSVMPDITYGVDEATVTFPDDPTFTYSGIIKVKERSLRSQPTSGYPKLFVFVLRIKSRNASASTLLNDGFRNHGVPLDPFPITSIMKIEVVGQRSPGRTMSTKFTLYDESVIRSADCFQRFTGGDDCSARTYFVAPPGQSQPLSATVAGFRDLDFPVETTQPPITSSPE